MKLFKLQFIVISLAFLSCSKSKPEISKPVDPPQHKPLRVLSYNIHHGAPAGNSSPINLDNIAAVIRQQDPDLVALQEVDKNTNRSQNDQAKVLGQKLGMQYFFSKSINYSGGEYGVALLSKFPIISSERILLSNQVSSGEQRSLGIITVDVPGLGKLRFGTVHLDLVFGNRQAQAEQLRDLGKTSAYPMILAGDFNMERLDTEFTPLKSEFSLSCTNGCPLTFPADKPVKEIDFILLNKKAAEKLSVQDYKAITGRLESDHLPLLGIYKF